PPLASLVRPCRRQGEEVPRRARNPPLPPTRRREPSAAPAGALRGRRGVQGGRPEGGARPRPRTSAAFSRSRQTGGRLGADPGTAVLELGGVAAPRPPRGAVKTPAPPVLDRHRVGHR